MAVFGFSVGISVALLPPGNIQLPSLQALLIGSDFESSELIGKGSEFSDWPFKETPL